MDLLTRPNTETTDSVNREPTHRGARWLGIINHRYKFNSNEVSADRQTSTSEAKAAFCPERTTAVHW